MTVSDTTGWVYDPEGIDVAALKEIKEVGTYTAVIKLHREVKVDVQFEVVSE